MRLAVAAAMEASTTPVESAAHRRAMESATTCSESTGTAASREAASAVMYRCGVNHSR